jgi:uncharacterized RDD family membrane protein YckC
MDGDLTNIQIDRQAGFISRLEAFVIDLVVLTISGVAATWIFELIFRFFMLNRIFSNLGSLQYSSVIFVILILAYYLYFWGLLGYTPGKFLLGLRIVRRDGRKLSIGRAFLRFFGYWVSALPLFLGFAWIIFDRRRQGWHDKLADTQVIYIGRKSPRG